MKVGPKELQTRLLGPPGIARQYGGEPKAGYTRRQPVTKKAVIKLRKSVTAVHKSTPPVHEPAVDSPQVSTVDKPVDTSVDTVDRRKAYKREWMRKQRAAAKTTS